MGNETSTLPPGRIGLPNGGAFGAGLPGVEFTNPPTLNPDVFPSIERNLYWIISLSLICLFYLGIPLALICFCACRSENYIPGTGWLTDETDLDMDILDDEKPEDDDSVKSTSEEGSKETEKKKSKIPIKLKKGISPYSVEVWLSRNGKLVSFLIFTIMGMMLALLYGVFLETILYQDKETRLLAIAIPIGRGFGVVTNFSMLLVLFFMARFPLTTLSNTPLSLILPLEVSFELHKIYGYITFFAGTVHGILQTVNFATNPNQGQTWDGMANSDVFGGQSRVVFGGRSTFVSGWILYIVFLMMISTFFKPVKSCFGYQGFLNVHKLWIVFIILLLFHGNEKGYPVYWKWAIAPLILLVWHYSIQYFSTTKRHKSILVLDKCQVDPGAGVIRLEVLRGKFNFKAGQYAFITIPALGTEKHPFTIASSPSEDTVTFFIKVFGDWTSKLYNLIETRKRSKIGLGPIHCTMRGGFGAPTEFAYQYGDVVLVGTGVGATPFISLMKDIIWQNSIREFITEEAYKLSRDPETAKKQVSEAQEHLHELEHELLISKNKKKPSERKKSKFFNSYSYGVFWQLILSILIVLTYVDSAPFNPDALNREGIPVTEIGEEVGNGRVFRTMYGLWFIFALIVILGYGIDIIYRVTVEGSYMKKRQMAEIGIHLILLSWLVVILIYRAVKTPVSNFEWRFGLSVILLAGLDNLNWFLYINRIGGNRLTSSRKEIVKSTNSLRFIYVDKKFDSADWIVEELLNVDKLAKQKLSNVNIIVDVYFSRDKAPPENEDWAKSQVINTYTGRPDWPKVVEMLIAQYSEKRKDMVEEKLEKADASFLDAADVDQEDHVIGMFFCGNPIVGDTLRKAAAKGTATKNFSIVWHQEAFG